jgi:DNA-binding transcriptional LysR family regulator
MSVELRQLRCLIAIVDAGTLTDAAIGLGVSQAAVSRTLAGLEAELGVRLLRRTARQVSPTAAGARVLPRARRLLAEADELAREAVDGDTHLRIGHAWSALGRHTVTFQRRWAQEHPGTALQLVRVHTATAGLAEGVSDLAVLRVTPDERRFGSVLVGLEPRVCAMAADDPWARRRSVRLADFADRTVLFDPRTGTTTLDLWPVGRGPQLQTANDVDDWLTAIASGSCVGITPVSTADQYPRTGVVFRPIPDAEPVAVRLAWWRDDPHPATRAAVALASELYLQG